jgi:integrase
VAISDTMARVSEINRLKWDDVNLDEGYLVLYTRKKRGGHLTPRKVPLTKRLAEILQKRLKARKKSNPWVFCACYEDWKRKKMIVAPFKQYRRTILKTLCKKAGVRHFTFHALRHAGASLMDHNNVPIGSIQRILGHENRSTTEIYLHTLRDAEREAIAVYERAMEKSHTDSHTDGIPASH